MRSIVNMNPFSDMQRMFDLMDRMSPARESSSYGQNVPLDVYEQDGQIKVRASVPGVKPEDLQLTFDNHVLTLSGEMRNEHEQREGNRVFHREHAYGTFTRSVRLPEDIDENNIDASFEHGVVTISIPRKQRVESQPRRLQIRTGSNSMNPQNNHEPQAALRGTPGATNDDATTAGTTGTMGDTGAVEGLGDEGDFKGNGDSRTVPQPGPGMQAGGAAGKNDRTDANLTPSPNNPDVTLR